MASPEPPAARATRGLDFHLMTKPTGVCATWTATSCPRNSSSLLGVETYRQVADEQLPRGDVSVKMLFPIMENKPGNGGAVSLHVGNAVVGAGDMRMTVPSRSPSYAGMDISRDNGLVVDRAYEDKAPYAFTGIVKNLVFDLLPGTVDELQALHHHGAVEGVAHGAAG